MEENAVDEWKRAYINYRGLKKLIKRVHEHYEERIQGSQLAPSLMPPGRAASRFFNRGFERRTLDSDNVANYGSTQESLNLEAQWLLPEVTLEGTGLEYEDDEYNEVAPGYHYREQANGSDRGHAESSQGESMARTSHDKPGSQHKSSISQDNSDPDFASSEDALEKFKVYIDRIFDASERKFYRALDHELSRIVDFYNQQEVEATERLETLVEQLLQLQEHRREFKARTRKIDSGNMGLQRFLAKMPRGLDNSELHRLKLSAQNRAPAEDKARATEDIGDKRRAEAIEHVHQRLDIGNSRPSSPHPHHSATPYDPVRYKAARKKLREAVIENYRALEILNNYRILNRTGFTKILKKFDKTLQVNTMDAYYEAKLRPSPLVHSETVPKMLEAVEEIYAGYFEHGNRKRARDILRVGSPQTLLQHVRGHHGSSFRTGLFLGVTLCLLIEGLRSTQSVTTRMLIPQWRSLLVLYAAEFLPTLFALLFGLNLVAWQRVRINTVFIFELDAGSALEPTQYFEIPAFFLFLLSVFFYVSFVGAPASHTVAPTTWPLVWLVVVAMLMVNPLDIMNKSSRYWFVRSLGRVFTGGVKSSVEFRDFFLGDELNSLAYSMSNLWLLGCEYDAHWSVPDRCNGNMTWWTPVLSALPAFLRLLQCIRRYVDSNCSVNTHLVNGVKYLTTILNYFFYFNYRHHNSHGRVHFALWVLFATINSLYACSWDIVMDWNLLQSNDTYPLLRSHLAFEDVWFVYYVAMVTNIIGRFVWVIYLFGGPASTPLRSFLAALIEMLRRWQWNFIRLENEHIGNSDSYKIVRDLPLPYPVKRVESFDDEDGHSFHLASLSPQDADEAHEVNEKRTYQTLQQAKLHLGAERARRKDPANTTT